MPRLSRSLTLLLLLTLTTLSNAAEEAKSIFNGKDLTGWEGNPEIWSVEDGAIVGRTVADKPIENNTFLVWKDGKPDNFRLTFEYKIEGGNSGVQYRSKVVDPEKFIVAGYQADIDSTPTYSGINYDERGRGILAKRGERARINREGKSEIVIFGDAEKLQKNIKANDWNQYTIEAVGPRLRHTINGKLMSVVRDHDAKQAEKEGVLAFQVHTGPPMVVRFRNIKLEKVDPKEMASQKKKANEKAKAKAETKAEEKSE